MEFVESFFSLFRPYIEFIPILVVGFFVGIAKCWQELKCWDFNEAIKHISHCSILCVITFGLLENTEFGYLAKTALSAGIGFYGVDKAVEIVKKILALRGHNPHDTQPPHNHSNNQNPQNT